MASLFPDGTGNCRLLDAGAGIGSLSAAFLDRWRNGGFSFSRVSVDAFELDTALIDHLTTTLDRYNHKADFVANIRQEDFIPREYRVLTWIGNQIPHRQGVNKWRSAMAS